MKNILKILLFTSFVFLSPFLIYSQTPCEVYEEIKNQGIRYPKIVFAQAVLETGWFKSPVCKQRYNLFGFNNGKMWFKSWQECVSYYKTWQDKHLKPQETDYFRFLTRIGYASAKNYNTYLKTLSLPACVD